MSKLIGIANPFAYRPHVAHMIFLARQLERLGHRCVYLECRGGLTNCNSRASKRGLAHRFECVKCRMAGVHSYLNVQPTRLDTPVELDRALLEKGMEYSYSSTVTALQVEHPAEARAPDFLKLQSSLSAGAATAYVNTRRWIREQKLDCVYVFNGRFDLTRAIIEACTDERLPYVSVERSWFGDGLQLLPNENCLGLRAFHELCARWRDRPLTADQAARANLLMMRRLSRTSVGEWRQYNVGNSADYANRRIRFLFLPSSQHEWLGTPDRRSGWEHPVEGLEYLFKRIGVPLSELVVRGHPGWSMRIKNFGANRADAFYRAWALRVGAEYIDAGRPVDSHQLIQASNYILLNGSSASMEAAWRGKPVASLVPSAFMTSGISRNLLSREAVDNLDPAQLAELRDPAAANFDAALQCRRVLRYMYCVSYRLMQFVDSIHTLSPYSFEYSDPADLSGLASLTEQGVLLESDRGFAEDDAAESAAVSAILAGNAASVHEAIDAPARSAGARITRRFGLGWVDKLSV